VGKGVVNLIVLIVSRDHRRARAEEIHTINWLRASKRSVIADSGK
jgi:hypothetical protein